MPRSRTLPLVLITLGSLTATAHTQNLITNGWTFSGYIVQPKVMPFDTTGTGISESFSNRPGSKAKTFPPGGSYTMQQNVLLLPVEHVLIADVAVANTQPLTNVDAGNFEFRADGRLLKRVKLGAIYPNQILRRQVCIRFTPTANAVRPLQIVFSRAWGAQPTTPHHHIDNIILLRLPKLDQPAELTPHAGHPRASIARVGQALDAGARGLRPLAFPSPRRSRHGPCR